MKKKYKEFMLEDHVNETGLGTLKGMQYVTFNDCMNGKQSPASRIKCNVLTAFLSFNVRYENYDVM